MSRKFGETSGHWSLLLFILIWLSMFLWTSCSSIKLPETDSVTTYVINSNERKGYILGPQKKDDIKFEDADGMRCFTKKDIELIYEFVEACKAYKDPTDQ